MSTFDDLLEKHRKPHRIYIFNVTSEVQSVCFPSIARSDKLLYERPKKEVP